MADLVNHPPHYTHSRFTCECIEFTSLFDFTLGNAAKYVWRYQDKGTAHTDLDKASFYLEWAIKSGRYTIGEVNEPAEVVYFRHIDPFMALDGSSTAYIALRYLVETNLYSALGAVIRVMELEQPC